MTVATPLGRVLVLSLEPWDAVWRRNQHLASRLPRLGLAEHVTFVEPARHPRVEPPAPDVPGVTVVAPTRRVPKRAGGHRLVARRLARLAQDCDVVWVNDPVVGARLHHPRVAYDVTDDWRSAVLTAGERRRLVAAEDRLARRAVTVVCSEELRRRWWERYRVEAVVVANAVDGEAIRRARPHPLPGRRPHAGYVGTLHDERLDVDLVVGTARDAGVTVHLVGPDCLSEATRRRLAAAPGVVLHGPVPAGEVPSWLRAFDVLLSPHVVSPFTLSLDALKAYEYLATERPVVATPTSGFQTLTAPGVTVTAECFPAAVARALAEGGSYDRQVPDWDDRVRDFAAALGGHRG